MSGTAIKIFGERNTATNALKQLIERNSKSHVLPSVARGLDRRFGIKLRVISKLPFSSVLREICIDGVFRGKSPRLAWKHAATYFGDLADFRECTVLNSESSDALASEGPIEASALVICCR